MYLCLCLYVCVGPSVSVSLPLICLTSFSIGLCNNMSALSVFRLSRNLISLTFKTAPFSHSPFLFTLSLSFFLTLSHLSFSSYLPLLYLPPLPLIHPLSLPLCAKPSFSLLLPLASIIYMQYYHVCSIFFICNPNVAYTSL